ncbi:hypothetical protein [Emcibacter nanhaiensis]|uniref:Uncharacterized protein n=1 Tax=Emcibacter nanhaiensis TaxID=1505037 RepID=A0A501PPC8_9PROT|nr:hypothetical protein [Emcibacter nanhaiensis]TPD61957.1 hypothetical protein FIV46_07065 [Emcibacter nanhaiensis]
MDEILASAYLPDGTNIHIATLSRKTIIDSGAEHLGFTGYFLFEAIDTSEVKGINVLCRVASIEAAFRLTKIWQSRDTTSDNRAA